MLPKSFIGTGTVLASKDPLKNGVLSIKPDKVEGNPAADIITAQMASPSIGAGAGIFNVPGPGSKVLYLDVNVLGLLNIPFKYIWFGALTSPGMQNQGRNNVASDALDADDACNTRVDPYGQSPGGETNNVYDLGIPNAGNVYKENNLPQEEIWLSKWGHLLEFARKITESGVHKNTVTISNPSGKKIVFDDGPPELEMDRITLTDELGNYLQFQTGGKDPNSFWLYTHENQWFDTELGGQFHTVQEGSMGDQVRQNLGQGDIVDIVARGHHRTEVEQNISRTSFKGNITEEAKDGNITYTASDTVTINVGATEIVVTEQTVDITCGESTVSMTPMTLDLMCGESTIMMGPASITMDSPLVFIKGLTGDAQIMGVSLVTHPHVGNLGAPTTPPIATAP